jgi:hypothetical protein
MALKGSVMSAIASNILGKTRVRKAAYAYDWARKWAFAP